MLELISVLLSSCGIRICCTEEANGESMGVGQAEDPVLGTAVKSMCSTLLASLLSGRAVDGDASCCCVLRLEAGALSTSETAGLLSSSSEAARTTCSEGKIAAVGGMPCENRQNK